MQIRSRLKRAEPVVVRPLLKEQLILAARKRAEASHNLVGDKSPEALEAYNKAEEGYAAVVKQLTPEELHELAIDGKRLRGGD